MDKMTAGLLGAVAGLATIGTAQASTAPATAPTLQAASYADLLQPIPNAVDLLKADNAARAQDAATSGSFQLADYYGQDYRGDYGPRYHHHHHHNYGERYGYNRRNEHHHHHHHHNNSWIGVPGVGGIVVHHD